MGQDARAEEPPDPGSFKGLGLHPHSYSSLSDVSVPERREQMLAYRRRYPDNKVFPTKNLASLQKPPKCLCQHLCEALPDFLITDLLVLRLCLQQLITIKVGIL